jgi:hypothetical protein
LLEQGARFRFAQGIAHVHGVLPFALVASPRVHVYVVVTSVHHSAATAQSRARYREYLTMYISP